MENRRSLFWDFYLNNLKTMLEHKLDISPIFEKEATGKIADQLGNQFKRELDFILSTGLVWLIRNENSPVNNSYDALFNNDNHKILEIFNKNIPSIMFNISQRMFYYREGVFRLLKRLETDWDELNTEFKLSNNKINGLNISLGDIHGGGDQTSSICISNNKKIIYKPVSLKIDILTNKLFLFLARICNKNIFTNEPNFLHINNYGYMEYIETKNIIDSYQQAELIYDKIAFFLAAACVLGIGDMHADNILISIPDVYLLDLETTFYSSEEIRDMSIFGNDVNPVSRSGMLLDINDIPPIAGIRTGIQGGEFPVSSRTVPIILNDGTDNLSIIYKRDLLPSDINSHNRLFYGDKTIVSIFENEKIFYDAFSKYYSIFLEKRDLIKAQIKSEFQNNDFRSRRIFCATALYRQLISLRQHIESHIDPNHQYWDKLIYQLKKPRKTEHTHLTNFIVENELMDLTKGIIPYFYRKNGDKHLYHISGSVLKDVYQHSLEEELYQHINRLPPTEHLMNYIRCSFASVRNIKTADDLNNILKIHELKRREFLEKPEEKIFQ